MNDHKVGHAFINCLRIVCFIALPGYLLCQTITLKKSFSGFNLPTHAISVDTQIIVAERFGSILKIPNVQKDSSELLGVIPNVGNAIYGIAFHPQYPDSNYIYVRYSKDTSFLELRLSRFSIINDSVQAQSEKVILSYDNRSEVHQGGNPIFGMDGYLYFVSGDGAFNDNQNEAISAQDPLSFYGKAFRIDVNHDDFPLDPNKNYGIPDDNPYVGNASYLPEIYAYGFRSPWRISQADDGTLYVGEVGEQKAEEINILIAGGNYGWPCYEGTISKDTVACFDSSALVFPYFHSEDRSSFRSITGGGVYTGSMSFLQGKYVFGDFSRGSICYYDGNEACCWNENNWDFDLNVVSFVEDHNQDFYAIDFISGDFYQIDSLDVQCSADTVITMDIVDSTLIGSTFTSGKININNSKLYFSEYNFSEICIFPQTEIYNVNCDILKYGFKH